jgi:energy-coupling factor transporter ATP-binding protein EcfA2
MHIEQLEFHRFKQFKDGQIKLRPGLTLVVGGNNAGKSSVLHGLAVWEFCKTILEFTRGRKAWISAGAGQGIGVSSAEFSPISVPSLKHLWNDLKTQRVDEPDGYTLKVRASWSVGNESKHLEFGLSLANDRLFIKTTSSDLLLGEVQADDGTPIPGAVPKVAYLPPFAGITDKESRNSVAVRNRLIGQGLSGGVIRNVLYDMWQRNRSERLRLRGAKSKISNADLTNLRKTDPWELLLKALAELFHIGLTVHEFDDRYHTYLHVETIRGVVEGATLKKAANDIPRDLMVEGSGFLQWLSVYALALSPDIDIVLLDEPDAHLHCSLQLELVRYLSELAESKGKQVLLATHSTELIRGFEFSRVLEVKNGKGSYLGEEGRKVGLLAGIGTIFSPKLHALAHKRRLLMLEGDFDQNVLMILAAKSGAGWPDNLVVWQWPGGHKERRQLFLQLKREIPELKAISIRDRDDEPDATVEANLIDKGHKASDDFKPLKWRRRHLENYLLVPAAIARLSGKQEEDVRQLFADNFGLALPQAPLVSDVLMAVRDARGKEIMTEGPASLESELGLSRYDIANGLNPDEIAEDLVTFFAALTAFAAP